MQENVVIYKSTILNYCMVSTSMLITFSSAEELLDHHRLRGSAALL